MTYHELKIDSHWYSLLFDQRKTCELRLDDRDYQIGDTVQFNTSAGYLSDLYTVTHVLKNYPGLQPGYVVLSLKHPDADWYRDEARRLAGEVERLSRSNASLRGQITKLRRRIGGAS